MVAEAAMAGAVMVVVVSAVVVVAEVLTLTSSAENFPVSSSIASPHQEGFGRKNLFILR